MCLAAIKTIPPEHRPRAWFVLFGNLRNDLNNSLKSKPKYLELQKLKSFEEFSSQYIQNSDKEMTKRVKKEVPLIYYISLIKKDLAAMKSWFPPIENTSVKTMFLHIIFRHVLSEPQNGYFAGLAHLVVPLFLVYFSEVNNNAVKSQKVGQILFYEQDIKNVSVNLSKEEWNQVELKTAWSFSVLIRAVIDRFDFKYYDTNLKVLLEIFGEFIKLKNPNLYEHVRPFLLTEIFKWLQHLLVRQLPMHLVIKLWDHYLSKKGGFTNLHFFDCAAILLKISEKMEELMNSNQLDFFSNIRSVLSQWTEEDIDEVIKTGMKLFNIKIYKKYLVRLKTQIKKAQKDIDEKQSVKLSEYRLERRKYYKKLAALQKKYGKTAELPSFVFKDINDDY
uniref:Rab-GAP TBC domain-containing protein n=1 Tax=Ditylenchus dipsaci TaxID=166011 RepID=A0A915CSC9_9BILA